MNTAKSATMVNWNGGNLFHAGQVARALELDSHTTMRATVGALLAYTFLFKEARHYRYEGFFNVNTSARLNQEVSDYGWYTLKDDAMSVDLGANPRLNGFFHSLMKGDPLNDKQAWAIVATLMESLGRKRCEFTREFYGRLMLSYNGIEISSQKAIRELIEQQGESVAVEKLREELQAHGNTRFQRHISVPDFLNSFVVENRLPSPSQQMPLWSRFFKARVVYNRTQTKGSVMDKFAGLVLAGLTFITNHVFDY